MKTKTFEYFHKDIKQLKIDIVFRMIFTALFLACFIWQIVSMFIIAYNSKITMLQGITSAFVLVGSLMLGVVTFSYAFKDLRIISAMSKL